MSVCAGDFAVPVGRARRGLDVRAVLRAAAGAGRAGPRPGRRRRLAARRHAAAGAAAETAAHRQARGKHLQHLNTLQTYHAEIETNRLVLW